MSAPVFSTLAIAPMIDWTYQHFRVFMRILCPKALLYTEMQTVGAVKHNPLRALAFDASLEHPIALQLGGSDPLALADCARMAEAAGFDEVNLNLGCPSDKVQAGQFGACLMRNPELVYDCLAAMRQAVSIPVTAKIRIGIDQEDSYDFLAAFVQRLVDAGIDKLIVHARKAWLNGLNPKQNRSIPPVNYPQVYRLKAQWPDLPMVINGNITDLPAVQAHLQQVEGVMLGRLACDNPYALAKIHGALYPEYPLSSRVAAVSVYRDYALGEAAAGAPWSLLIKPIFNLAHGLPHAGQWKKALSQLLVQPSAAGFDRAIEQLDEIERTNPPNLMEISA